jgi:hypothetical protein
MAARGVAARGVAYACEKIGLCIIEQSACQQKQKVLRLEKPLTWRCTFLI